jgi:multiple sugar transport system permease protein
MNASDSAVADSGTAPKRKRSKVSLREARTAYIFLIPAFVGLVVLTYLPLIAVFVLSFFKWKGAGVPTFNGITNYVNLFTTDPYFMDSIRVTFYFSVLAVIGSLLYSLIIAILLNRKIPARGLFRAIFYLPYILPAVAVYIGWAWLYESNFGLFNYILSQLGMDRVNFIADPKLVVPSLALIAVWLSGNLIVIFLAGLQNVPRVYHEAAEIDGASSWQRFWHVTIPSITPIIFYNLLMALVTNLQIVTPALALTGGGPGNASRFMTYLMYDYAFKKANFGYASAVSFVFFIIIAIFTGFVFASSRKWVYYEGGDGK